MDLIKYTIVILRNDVLKFGDRWRNDHHKGDNSIPVTSSLLAIDVVQQRSLLDPIGNNQYTLYR